MLFYTKYHRNHSECRSRPKSNWFIPENAANVDPSGGDSGGSESSDLSIRTQDANLTIASGEHSKNERSLMITSANADVSRSTGMI